jgi:spore coat protein U-like protein
MRSTLRVGVIGKAAAVAALIGITGAAAPVFAATASTNLGVSATVINNCLITTSALAFGSYDPVVANSAADLDGTGVVSVACTKGVSPTIALGLGSNASGSTRRMGDGSGHYLTYELFKESGHVTVWGTAGGALLSPSAAPSKDARDFTVYGRVTGGQDATAGSYTDTVVATVNF